MQRMLLNKMYNPSRNDFKVKVRACTGAWSSSPGPGGLIHYNFHAGYVVLGRAWTGSLTYVSTGSSYFEVQSGLYFEK